MWGEGELQAWPGFAGYGACGRRRWGHLMAGSCSLRAWDRLWGWVNLDGPSFSKVPTYMNVSMYEMDNVAGRIFLLCFS